MYDLDCGVVPLFDMITHNKRVGTPSVGQAPIDMRLEIFSILREMGMFAAVGQGGLALIGAVNDEAQIIVWMHAASNPVAVVHKLLIVDLVEVLQEVVLVLFSLVLTFAEDRQVSASHALAAFCKGQMLSANDVPYLRGPPPARGKVRVADDVL